MTGSEPPLGRDLPGPWWCRIARVPARSFRGERGLSIAFRTAHLLGVGLVLGGAVWGIGPVRVRPAMLVAVLSGAALVAIELYKSLHWLFQGKGLFVLAKLLLLAWLPFAGGAAPLLLGAVVVLGSVGAHLPSRYRHYSILLRKPVLGSPKAASPSSDAVAKLGWATPALVAPSVPPDIMPISSCSTDSGPGG